jgi:hypothetical protein
MISPPRYRCADSAALVARPGGVRRLLLPVCSALGWRVAGLTLARGNGVTKRPVLFWQGVLA